MEKRTDARGNTVYSIKSSYSGSPIKYYLACKALQLFGRFMSLIPFVTAKYTGDHS